MEPEIEEVIPPLEHQGGEVIELKPIISKAPPPRYSMMKPKILDGVNLNIRARLLKAREILREVGTI